MGAVGSAACVSLLPRWRGRSGVRWKRMDAWNEIQDSSSAQKDFGEKWRG